jgi:hypothetical protein
VGGHPFVEDNQAAAWWRMAGEVDALGGASAEA